MDRMLGMITKSMMVARIVLPDGTTLGALEVCNHADDDPRFGGMDMWLIQWIAKAIAPAVVNCLAYEAKVKAQGEADDLAQFHSATLSGRSFEVSVLDMRKLCQVRLNAEKAWVFFMDEVSGLLRNYSDDPSDDEQRGTLPASSGLIGAAMEMAPTALRLRDPEVDLRFIAKYDRSPVLKGPLRNMMVVPLMGAHGKAVGVIQVVNSQAGSFTEHDEQFVERVGLSLSAAHAINMVQKASERREVHLHSILKCSRECFTSRDCSHAVRHIEAALHKLMEFDSVMMFLRHPTSEACEGERSPGNWGHLLRFDHKGEAIGRFPDGEEELGEMEEASTPLGVAGAVLHLPAGSVVRLGLGDLEHDERYDPDIDARVNKGDEASQWVPVSILSTALLGMNGQPVGAISVAFLAGGQRAEFSAPNEGTLSELARNVGPAFEMLIEQGKGV